MPMAGRIAINPGVMPVRLLLRKLAQGGAIADLLDAYPRLSADDIRAALDYAADTITHETVVEFGS